MKPRTAEEIAAWARIGVDIERADRWEAENPDAASINAYTHRAWNSAPARSYPSEAAPDGRLLVNPNPVDKRFFND